MDKYFKKMASLDDGDKKDSFKNYFRFAGDLDVSDKISGTKVVNSGNKIDKINEYLITVVSGKRYPAVCELGVLMGSGRMIVNLEELKNLVESGCNIVNANVINADREMIEIEVQRYEYDKDMMERRSRF